MFKKLFSMLLVITLVLGMGTTAFAAIGTNDKITDVIQSIDFNTSLDTSEIRPGRKLIYPLTADMFEWSSGAKYAKYALTLNQLKGITVDSRGVNSKIMKNPVIKIETVDKIKTACVVLEFVEDWVSISEVDFDVTLYLRLNRSRKTESDIQITGKFGCNTVDIDSYETFYEMSPGEIVIPSEYIKDIELELGDGLSMFTKLFANRKYMGYAKAGITNDDDAIVSKYPNIVEIYRVSVLNLDKTSKNMKVIGYDDCFVYSKDGKYLGKTSEKFQYSDILYITDKQIDMGSGAVSSSSTDAGEDAPPEPESGSSTASTTPTTSDITTDQLSKLTATAINTAKSNGSKTATVRVKDAKTVSAEALQAMAKAASAAGYSSQLNCDIMSGKTTTGRLTINPALASNLTDDINVGVFVDDASVGAIRDKFDKWYSNNTQVVSMGQKGSYGMTVNVSAKVDFSGDHSKIRLYSFDAQTNKFKELTDSGVKIDNSGYIQFKTTVGNEIIISEGALTRA